MGNIAGSCIGSFTGTCALAICAGGDLSEYPNTITNGLDALLTIVPIISYLFFSTSVVIFQNLVLGSLLANFFIFISGKGDKKLYGARFLLPIALGLMGEEFNLLSLPIIPPWLCYTCIGSLGIVATLCLVDFGHQINFFVRLSFDYLYSYYVVLVLYQIALVILSGTVLWYSIGAVGGDCKYFFVVAGVTILAVWDFSVYNAPRGSIMSVAILMGGLALVLKIPVSFPLIMVSLYNNFFLHRESRDDKLSATPLLTTIDREASNKSSTGEIRSKFFLNSLINISQSLVICDGWNDFSGDQNSPLLFLTVSLLLYVWTILAPIVFTGRVFG